MPSGSANDFALNGLLSVQGPKAEAVVRSLGLFSEIPNAPLNSVKVADATLGEIYLMNQMRIGSPLDKLPVTPPGFGRDARNPPRRTGAPLLRPAGFVTDESVFPPSSFRG